MENEDWIVVVPWWYVMAVMLLELYKLYVNPNLNRATWPYETLLIPRRRHILRYALAQTRVQISAGRNLNIYPFLLCCPNRLTDLTAEERECKVFIII